tara:strand:- start:923 stop:1528 length:606 start_codon:yes stop_codon:yes gene_type:complete
MKKTNLRQLYDELYNDGYHDIKKNMSHSRNLIKIINDTTPKNKKILDVGCSHGFAVDQLIKLRYNAYGIDIADKAIEYCINRGLVNCKYSNANNIDFEDDMFDIILSTDTLEHIPTEDIDKVINEFNRITKKEAFLFIKVAKVVEFNKSWNHIIKNYEYKDLHLTTENLKFWENKLNKFFKTINVIKDNHNFFEIILKKNK